VSNHLEKLDIGPKVDDKNDSVTGEIESKERIVEQPFVGSKENRGIIEAV
jgi:hypothetical protein